MSDEHEVVPAPETEPTEKDLAAEESAADVAEEVADEVAAEGTPSEEAQG